MIFHSTIALPADDTALHLDIEIRCPRNVPQSILCQDLGVNDQLAPTRPAGGGEVVDVG